MDKKEIKRVARQVDNEIRKRARKSQRTLSLTEEPFIRLQALAKAQEVSVSEIVDMLIRTYVEIYE
jgi:hypothetical protein